MQSTTLSSTRLQDVRTYTTKSLRSNAGCHQLPRRRKVGRASQRRACHSTCESFPYDTSATCSFHHVTEQHSVFPTRRGLLGTLFGATLSSVAINQVSLAEEVFEVTTPRLLEYTDPKDGYTVLHPAGWKRSSKSGASILFQDPDQKFNTVGVLVVPVRIKSLQQFGTLDFGADKLLGVERAKPITQAASMVSKVEQQTATGPMYLYEFEVTTDYGTKTCLALVAVANQKLFNLNVTYGQNGFYGETSSEMVGDLRKVFEGFAILG